MKLNDAEMCRALAQGDYVRRESYPNDKVCRFVRLNGTEGIEYGTMILGDFHTDNIFIPFDAKELDGDDWEIVKR